MKVFESLEDLSDESLHKGFFERSVLVQERSNRASRNILQENIEIIAVSRRI